MTTDISLGDRVCWTPTGEVGRVLGLTTEPSAIVDFGGGRRVTIGCSKLAKVTEPRVDRAYWEAAGRMVTANEALGHYPYGSPEWCSEALEALKAYDANLSEAMRLLGFIDKKESA